MTEQEIKEWFYACEHDEIGKIKKMIATGIDVNFQDKDGWTALMYACVHGNEEMVKVLLEQENINVNLQDRYDRTALMINCGSVYRNSGRKLPAFRLCRVVRCQSIG